MSDVQPEFPKRYKSAARAAKRAAESGRVKTVLLPTGKQCRRPRHVAITGAAGFIGTNVAAELASAGERVLIYDNLSRAGVAGNLQWLSDTFGSQIDVEIADVGCRRTLRSALGEASKVFHFAAQVAVTTSLEDPIRDFETNARGTLNVLETLRELPSPPPLLFTSTNKVYGGLEHVELVRDGDRYVPADAELRRRGVSERCPLDFHSPYGCSKGAADQYLRDFARSYAMPTVVFRMSCIYGPHQWGTEDQGWVAHFVRQFLENKPLTIYGDGCQVRDLLYVGDLVRAMQLAIEHLDRTRGRCFNMGGGPGRTVSLLELIELLEGLHGSRPPIAFADWRVGDQRYYVSDTRAIQRATGWKPRVELAQGIELLYRWLRDELPSAQATLSEEHAL